MEYHPNFGQPGCWQFRALSTTLQVLATVLCVLVLLPIIVWAIIKLDIKSDGLFYLLFFAGLMLTVFIIAAISRMFSRDWQAEYTADNRLILSREGSPVLDTPLSEVKSFYIWYDLPHNSCRIKICALHKKVKITAGALSKTAGTIDGGHAENMVAFAEALVHFQPTAFFLTNNSTGNGVVYRATAKPHTL